MLQFSFLKPYRSKKWPLWEFQSSDFGNRSLAGRLVGVPGLAPLEILRAWIPSTLSGAGAALPEAASERELEDPVTQKTVPLYGS
jgi:hypothetical protein